MQQYSKTRLQTFRCQDSKACPGHFNAKSNVHSLNNIRAPETSLISVCYRIGFSAARARGGGGSIQPGKDRRQSRPIPSTKAVFYTDLRAVPFSMQ